MRVCVVGPIADDVREVLGAELEHDEEFKTIQGGLLLTFPVERAVGQIASVRNEIAHVREVGADRLLRASVACADVLEMLRAGAS
jgi:hypothetical protein